MQIGHRALCMGRRLKNRPLVTLEDIEPGLKVAGVIRPGLELRRDAEIGAEKTASEFGHELFACTFGAVLVVT